jgi:hypothetical protein
VLLFLPVAFVSPAIVHQPHLSPYDSSEDLGYVFREGL